MIWSAASALPAKANVATIASAERLYKALDKAWEGKPFREIAEAPVSALAGVTEKDVERLAQAFGTQTPRDLANNKPSGWARAAVIAADLEEWRESAAA